MFPLTKLVILLLASVATGQETEPQTQRPKAQIGPRIVGGSRARTGQFPHQVSLRMHGAHICGGTIISPNYILTAAHCVKFGSTVADPRRLAVQAGSLKLDAQGTYASVAAVQIHPSYGNGGQGYDVALLRLSRRLSFNANINSIPLATSDPAPNTTVHISGWGDTYHGGPKSNDLLFVQVTTITRNQCTSRYLSTLPQTTMCLMHGANLGACHGDSGGPATLRGTLVGVASFVLGRCGQSAPDGYERVSFHRSWIMTNAGLNP